MFRSLFNLIIIYFQITLSYILFGVIIFIILDIEVPFRILLLVTWIVAPVVSAFLSFLSAKYLNIKRAKPYIMLSFSINLLSILIYTWFENRQPHIEGDFMDFRGLIFTFYGIGQIVGIIFTVLFKEKGLPEKNKEQESR